MYQISSDVDARYKKQVVDAKSLMGLMMISVNDITVSINSDDEKELETFRQRFVRNMRWRMGKITILEETTKEDRK